MKNDLQDKAIELIDKLVDGPAAKLQSEFELLIQESMQYNFVCAVFWESVVVVGLLISLFIVFLCYRNYCSVMKAFAESDVQKGSIKERQLEREQESAIGASVIFGGLSLVMFIIMAFTTVHLIKTSIAPRVLIVEQMKRSFN